MSLYEDIGRSRVRRRICGAFWVFATWFGAAAAAHWVEHPDLPRWARRGRLHWALNYGRTTRELVDLFAAQGQNLVHGGRFDSAATARYARSRGLHYMPYVCSRTVRTREIARHPELAHALVLRADGSEYLAYNNPVRRYGCLHVAAWPQYVLGRVRRVWDLPDVAAIFFDNAMWSVDDHNPANIRAWKQWAVRHGIAPGADVPSIYANPGAAASRAFSLESLTAYHAMLQEACHRHVPRLLNCPNAGSPYGLAVAESGKIDLFFYETMTHPPFVNNAFRYKAGLAATHGRPTAVLAYLPASVAADRGVRTWNEAMHHYFFVASPLPDEFALAAAEGAACGGTYVVNYNLFPSLPITDPNDPFCRRIYRALEQTYTFLRANEDLYAGARPGSDVAVLYSPITDVQDRRLQDTQQLNDALAAAGIPYEVVVPSDLTAPGGMRGVRALIVSGVAYAGSNTAAGLLRFVRNGGHVILTGEFAAFDRLGRPANFPAADRLRAALELWQRPIRAWRLRGFEPEGISRVRVAAKQATARTVYTGPPGRFTAFLCLLDENDGASTVTFSVRGHAVYRRLLDVDDGRRHWLATPAFQLKPGDAIALHLVADAGERGRVYAVTLAAAAAVRDGAALGRGRISYVPAPLYTLPAARLLDLLRPSIRLVRPGKAFINVMDVPGRGLRTVHLVNYDFRYQVRCPGRYGADDGRQDARVFFGGPATVIRKRIRIPHPGRVVKPVLTFYGLATPDCTAQLEFRLNGRPAGRFPAEKMRSPAWYEIPLDRRFLARVNTVEIRAAGRLDGMKHWLQIGIDADTRAGNSEFSRDGGRSFQGSDLSPDRGNQVGEYMVRIVDKDPGGLPGGANGPVRNPGFENVRTPHSETRLTVVPARRLEVEMTLHRKAVPACLAMAPDAPPRWLSARVQHGRCTLAVPPVRIYTVLVLAADRKALEPLRAVQLRAAGWTLPPVTAPLRPKVAGWQGYGRGFVPDRTQPHSGRWCIRCDNGGDGAAVRGAAQTLEFTPGKAPAQLVITAWSRARKVSGKADSNYAIYVDAACTDGTIFNGRNAPFRTGSHGWEPARLRLNPPAPLRRVRLFLLFRRHAGAAWFDDVRVTAPARGE